MRDCLSHLTLEEQIITVAQKLYQKEWLASADGNISIKINDQKIIITPSGYHKGYLSEKDLCLINIDNQVIRGNPSGERLMHLEIYRSIAKAKAVIHAHPPYAISWSIAYPELRELPKESLSELILAVGAIPIVPYARPGSEEMGKVLRPYLPQHQVFILSRHGALSWGNHLFEAYCGIERLEHTAKILYLAQTLNGLSQLPKEEIDYLIKMRQSIGEKIL